MRHVRQLQHVGVMGILLGLVACATPTPPSPTPGPAATVSPTFTSTPTATPTCTPTPTPTATPTPIPTPVRPPGADRWVLAEEERLDLYQASLEFLAPTHEEALEVAHDLQFLVEHGHPSNMCGPLAVGILRDAGLIDSHVILHEFWLLNPRELDDAWLLQGVFPSSRYASLTSWTSIGQFDFAEFPLEPGDFLYLFAGPGGTFEHVIVVNRVDEEGRAFAVSNVKREGGFLIEEILLYDPNEPGRGMFYEWTDPAFIQFGQTGLGGFQLWRPVEILRVEGAGEAGASFRGRLDRLLEDRGGHWSVAVKQRGDAILYYRGAEEVIHPAFAIEIPVALLFFHGLEAQGVENLQSYVGANGIRGRTFYELLQATLQHSEPGATSALASWVEEQLAVEEVLSGWGLHNTGLDPRRSSVWDVALAFEGLIEARFVSPEAAAIILGLMEGRDPDGAGLLCSRQGSRCILEWRASGGVVGGVVVLEAGGETYLLAVNGRASHYGERPATWGELQQGVEEVHQAFAETFIPGE